MTQNITHIKPHLREAKSGEFVSKQTINKANNSKSLLNPIFAPYKTVLRYAEYIIRLNTLQESVNTSKDQCFGFLVNVAELFEIYVTKLLQRGFPDWRVSSPKIELYEEMFYARKIIPDIVMQRDQDMLVFDTKYKRMNYIGRQQNSMGDVDRNDFFQINTYMSFYQQQEGKLLGGGLLYPLSAPFDEGKCHSVHWLRNQSVPFIVDGIEVGADILKAEELFIARVREMAQSKAA
jgi:5-methylcytosine-specific restriction endonuclease McrBC regulatory subunit McrC